MYKPIVIDLFCGVGGFSYGFKKAGYNVILGIDFEKSKLLTYQKNIQSQTLNSDVTKLSVNDICNLNNGHPIDVLIGSPPCQEYSSSNPKKKSEMDRTLDLSFRLPYYFLSFVMLLRPKVFVMENVNGFFKTRDYMIINNIFKTQGYTTFLNSINVKNFAIPQNRERSFLIGNLFNKEIKLIETNNHGFVSLIDAIGDLEDIIPLNNYNNLLPLKINTNYKFSDFQKKMHSKDKISLVFNHVMPTHTLKTIEILKNLKSGDSYNKNKSHTKSYGSDLSKPITSKFATPSGDGETMHYNLPRCLTLREAARIQSFDDNFIFITEKISKELIGKMIGDAVPPLMSEIIAKQILPLFNSIDYYI